MGTRFGMHKGIIQAVTGIFPVSIFVGGLQAFEICDFVELSVI
jgi:hypothetical protein